ncbi:HIT domain-containing protein [Candidatus Fermentibacteria bacterium]|nr:HIT domain-containing protein [Candidatus Fermentibacteria bacterium]
MERIWAPWRMEYVGCASETTGCVLCHAAEGNELVLSVTDHVIILLNKYPYTTGHLMVSPLRHVPDLESLQDDELWHLVAAVRFSETVLKREYRPDGLNIGFNLGACAGAGVLGHVHVHLVPRWKGDTNFMPVIGEVRVLPESLERSFERLRPYFEAQ